MHLSICKDICVPDPIKVARYSHAPHLGPRILFFSGGTALRAVSQRLIDFTHNSMHIITPFDSGGSSAVLRQAFSMPAVGDIRNRLMALADQSIQGNPATYDLFAHRLPAREKQARLQTRLQDMIDGRHELMRAVPDPLQRIIRRHLLVFSRFMPQDFDLRGASIGNLILAAGYLENERDLDPVIFIYSKLAEVRGTVRAVVKGDFHLGADLADGRRILGQHRLTGKQTSALTTPITSLFLTAGHKGDKGRRVQAEQKVQEDLYQAELICYPMGSFYTSLLANLLPQGVSQSIKKAECPKVFVPNTYADPECVGMDLRGQVQTLLSTLEVPPGQAKEVLNFVLLDSRHSRYPGGGQVQELRSLGVEVITTDLVTPQSDPGVDPDRLVAVLLSLA